MSRRLGKQPRELAAAPGGGGHGWNAPTRDARQPRKYKRANTLANTG
jgi:hypothetical protein